MNKSIVKTLSSGLLASAFAAVVTCAPAIAQQQQKTNIVIIWGDDIGQSNVSAYSRGLMGYQTPNIDRIANEGVMFTDYYAEQSCTAGRSTFITGQVVLRTGMSKVGLPGAKLGLQKERLYGAQVFVLPSSSGLNALGKGVKMRYFRQLAALLRRLPD